MYLDCNALYSTAMIDRMPYGGFKWLEKGKIDSIDFMHVSNNADTGFLIECDPEYRSIYTITSTIFHRQRIE
uniref:DNA-directed DNA polymerase n=1 Tax=Strigamia maritima TaxID=126957 RepID=T1IJI8_STRMM